MRYESSLRSVPGVAFACTFAFALALSLSSLAASGCATSGDTEYGEEVDETAGSPGKLSLWESADGRFHFHLEASNGAILLVSEAYTSRTGAVGGVLSVLENGVDSARYEIAAATGGYVVHLVAANRETIGSSEIYASKWGAQRVIAASVSSITAYLDRREAATGARLEVQQRATGAFHWDVRAASGEIVLSSESYTTEAAAYNGALAAQLAGQARGGYEVRESAAGSFYFVVKAANGHVVGTSELYAARASADAAIASLMGLLPAITVL
jgi:uncharacterized protein